MSPVTAKLQRGRSHLGRRSGFVDADLRPGADTDFVVQVRAGPKRDSRRWSAILAA